MTAHAFAAQLDVNPWDALLMAVRIAAGKVAYIETVLAGATSDLELEGRVGRQFTAFDDSGRGIGTPLLLHPDTGEPLGVGEFRDLSWWVKQSELWHERMAKTAKMAIDAGVAVWQVRQVEEQAQAIARVLNGMLESAVQDGLDDTMVVRLRTYARKELLQLEREASGNGQVRSGGAGGTSALGALDLPQVDSRGLLED